MRKLYTFGDSFTVCREIKPGHEYYDKYTSGRTIPWPNQLAESLNLELKNYGILGASYLKILSSLIINLGTVEKNSLVVVSGTSALRQNIPNRVELKIDPYIDYTSVQDVKRTQELLQLNLKQIENSKKATNILFDFKHTILLPMEKEFRWYYDNLIFNTLMHLKKVQDIEFIFWNWGHVFDSREYENIINHTNGKIADSHLSYNGNQQLYEVLLKGYKSNKSCIGFDNLEQYFDLDLYKVYKNNIKENKL